MPCSKPSLWHFSEPWWQPAGCLGAKNIFPQRLWHFGLRRLFDGLRGIDTLIRALMFVNAGGLGPTASTSRPR
jgi:ABC-type phosphate/phosphonate transport system permease subunit